MPRKGFKKSEEQIQKDREAAIKRHHGEDIKYLSDTHPDIAKEWHPTKNDNKHWGYINIIFLLSIWD